MYICFSPAKVENANGNKSFTMKLKYLQVDENRSAECCVAQKWPRWLLDDVWDGEQKLRD